VKDKPKQLVHYYDVVRGSTVCGAPVFDNSFTVFQDRANCQECAKSAAGRTRAAMLEGLRGKDTDF